MRAEMREIPSTLLLGCLGGDESCWQELIRLTGGHLQRIARVNLRDPILTDDVLQETYFKVFRNLHRLRDREKARSWIVQILVNECRMMNRKTKREDQSQGEESLSYVFGSTGNSHGRTEP